LLNVTAEVIATVFCAPAAQPGRILVVTLGVSDSPPWHGIPAGGGQQSHTGTLPAHDTAGTPAKSTLAYKIERPRILRNMDI